MAKKKVPEIVEHAVAKVMKKKKVPREQAYAIVVGGFQKAGILKKGTLKLTQKGRAKSAKHYKEPKKIRLAKVNMARKHKKKTL